MPVYIYIYIYIYLYIYVCFNKNPNNTHLLKKNNINVWRVICNENNIFFISIQYVIHKK